MQTEAELANGQRRGHDDAGVALEGDLHRAATELGAGGREAGDRGGNELGESRVALGEVIIDVEDVGVGVDVDDAATLEVAEDAEAGDLERIGYVSGCR